MCDRGVRHRDVQNPVLQLLGEKLDERVLESDGRQTVASVFASRFEATVNVEVTSLRASQ